MAQQIFRLGTVAAVYTSGGSGITVKFDGESSASDKRFKCNTEASFYAGQRVLCANVSGTWIVLCGIGDPS